MKSKIEVTFEGDHILARTRGYDSYDVSYEIMSKIVEACETHGCYNILGISDMMPLDISTAFDQHKIFSELGVTMKHRIAWVEKNEKSREVLEFCEMVLRNRGLLNGGLFSDEAEARQWLLGSQDAEAPMQKYG